MCVCVCKRCLLYTLHLFESIWTKNLLDILKHRQESVPLPEEKSIKVSIGSAEHSAFKRVIPNQSPVNIKTTSDQSSEAFKSIDQPQARSVQSCDQSFGQSQVRPVLSRDNSWSGSEESGCIVTARRVQTFISDSEVILICFKRFYHISHKRKKAFFFKKYYIWFSYIWNGHGSHRFIEITILYRIYERLSSINLC